MERFRGKGKGMKEDTTEVIGSRIFIKEGTLTKVANRWVITPSGEEATQVEDLFSNLEGEEVRLVLVSLEDAARLAALLEAERGIEPPLAEVNPPKRNPKYVPPEPK